MKPDLKEQILNVKRPEGKDYPIYIEFLYDGVWMLNNEKELRAFKWAIKKEIWDGKL